MRDDSVPPPFDPSIVPAHAEEAPRWPPVGERVKPSIAPARTPPAAPHAADKKHPEQKDTFREIVETVVFVVVLVLLLKAFMAEAFVIPTGSMATTLLGYHREITCPECGHRFPLNMSKEMDSQEQNPQRITGCTCENCQLHIDATNSEQFRGQ